MTPHSRDNPRFCEKQRPSKTRAQGRPGAGRTRSLVCSEGSTRVIHHRLDRNIRPSLRDGVNAYFRALPGVRDLIVTVASQVILQGLAPAQGRQDHTISSSAFHGARRATQPASIVSRPTFVTTRSPLLPRRDGITIIIIWKTEAKYFLQRGWTGICKSHLSGKSLGKTYCSARLLCRQGLARAPPMLSDDDASVSRRSRAARRNGASDRASISRLSRDGI
jgi:hypothetical protein